MYCHHDITSEGRESPCLVAEVAVGSLIVDGDMVGDDMWSSLNSLCWLLYTDVDLSKCGARVEAVEGS